jgi:hypothetical protein
MMRKIAVFWLLPSLALGACEESTAPEGEVILRLAHAAAGAGTFEVSVGGEVLESELGPGEFVLHTTGVGPNAIRFEGGGRVAEIQPVYRTPGREYAVILHDPSQPGIHVVRRPSIPGASVEVVLGLVNMVPGTNGLTISLEAVASADGASVSGLAYSDDGTVGLDEGAYEVTVTNADGSEAVELGTVELTAGHAFLALMPDPDGALAGGFVLF